MAEQLGRCVPADPEFFRLFLPQTSQGVQGLPFALHRFHEGVHGAPLTARDLDDKHGQQSRNCHQADCNDNGDSLVPFDQQPEEGSQSDGLG